LIVVKGKSIAFCPVRHPGSFEAKSARSTLPTFCPLIPCYGRCVGKGVSRKEAARVPQWPAGAVPDQTHEAARRCLG